MGLSLSEGTCLHANSARSRTAASRVQPYRGVLGGAKSRGIIAACILLLLKNGGRKRAWGNRGLSAAVPNNDGVSSGWQQASRSGYFVSRSFMQGPATSRGGGGRSGHHGVIS